MLPITSTTAATATNKLQNHQTPRRPQLPAKQTSPRNSNNNGQRQPGTLRREDSMEKQQRDEALRRRNDSRIMLQMLIVEARRYQQQQFAEARSRQIERAKAQHQKHLFAAAAAATQQQQVVVTPQKARQQQQQQQRSATPAPEVGITRQFFDLRVNGASLMRDVDHLMSAAQSQDHYQHTMAELASLSLFRDPFSFSSAARSAHAVPAFVVPAPLSVTSTAPLTTTTTRRPAKSTIFTVSKASDTSARR